MEEIIVKIPKVKFSVFTNLLEQSLLVTNQLMLQFDKNMIKSCSFSVTRSFIKLWTIKTTDLISEDVELSDFEPFNFYVLRGDSFKKEIQAHTSAEVDLEFKVFLKDGKFQAQSLKLTSELMDSPFETNADLTTEDMITNKVDDYNKIISECTPDDSMSEIIITDKQIYGIKKQIKLLNKASAKNTSYLTFNYDNVEKTIQVKDKVFNIRGFKLPENIKEIVSKIPTEPYSFDILKSDFVKIGNHTFSIYTETESEKVILGTKHGKAIIWGLLTKVDKEGAETANILQDDDGLDNFNLESLDIGEYIDD